MARRMFGVFGCSPFDSPAAVDFGLGSLSTTGMPVGGRGVDLELLLPLRPRSVAGVIAVVVAVVVAVVASSLPR